jgi:hypothetical protein
MFTLPLIASVYYTDDGSCIAAETFILSNLHSWLVYLSEILRLMYPPSHTGLSVDPYCFVLATNIVTAPDCIYYAWYR